MFKPLQCTFLLLACLVLAACNGSSNLDKLNGKWIGDAKASLEKSGEDASDPMVAEMAEKLFAAITLTVDVKAKTMEFAIGKESQTGSFTVAEDSGDKLVLKTADNMKMEFTFLGPDSISLVAADDTSKVFVMKKAK